MPNLPNAELSAPPRRNRKVFAACQRCRFRKIRCDGALPSCTNCQKAGTACMDPHRQKTEIPRSYISSLESKIHLLEAIIAKRCPDVDLSSDNLLQDVGPQSSQSFTENATPNPDYYGSESIERLLMLLRPEHADCASPAFSRSVESCSEPLTHVVGLVSLNGSSEPKYLGPSSGFSFVKLLVKYPGSSLETEPKDNEGTGSMRQYISYKPLPLPPFHEAIILVEAFFDATQWQYPFLHKPSFLSSLKLVYSIEDRTRTSNSDISTELGILYFQIFMVLAVGASSMLGKLEVAIEAGNYFASAMQYSDMALYKVSLRTTQNHLLLAMYAMFNPGSDINIWFINYLLMASCIDLGFHRDISSRHRDSQLERDDSPILEDEIRKRVFWSCYALDRNIGTALGRPLGIRDEACDVELPIDIDDEALESANSSISYPGQSSISSAIHLFQLAIITTDIKLHLYRVCQDLNRIPWPRNLDTWRERIFKALNDWKASVPGLNSSKTAFLNYLYISYHRTIMLLFRPSPRFPRLSTDTARICSASAIQAIQIFESLQRYGRMQYTVLTVHDAFLSGLTMLYSAQVLCEADGKDLLIQLPNDIKRCSSVLSVIADQGWPHAKRSLNIFNIVSNVTLTYLRNATSKLIPKQPISINPMTTSTPSNGTTNSDINNNHIKEAPISTNSGQQRDMITDHQLQPESDMFTGQPLSVMYQEQSVIIPELNAGISYYWPLMDNDAQYAGLPVDVTDWANWDALIPGLEYPLH
ncbi:hypothetical protein B7463_g10002, partial [Scytalidium lignicola]